MLCADIELAFYDHQLPRRSNKLSYANWSSFSKLLNLHLHNLQFFYLIGLPVRDVTTSEAEKLIKYSWKSNRAW